MVPAGWRLDGEGISERSMLPMVMGTVRGLPLLLTSHEKMAGGTVHAMSTTVSMSITESVS